MKEFDIIIIGAGVVGLSFACMLAERSTLSILVIDSKTEFEHWSDEYYSSRVNAVTWPSINIFNNLSLWSAIEARRISPFRSIEVAEAAKNTQIKFDAAAIDENYLGYIIETSAMHDALFERAKNFPTITLQLGAQLDSIALNTFARGANNDSCQMARMRVVTNSGEILQAALVVGADGINSWVRKQCDIASKKKNYHQKAIVANVRTRLKHDQIARQLFLGTGPLAFLPLNDSNLCSIVWSITNELADELITLNDQAFMHALAEKFTLLGEILQVSQRLCFPLTMHHARQFVNPHIALIGDAAHSVHPLAGLGVNMGLFDAACLADVVLASHQAGKNFASHQNLRRYERQSKANHWPLLMSIDGLHQIYQTKSHVLAMIRNAGMLIFNQLSPLKSMLINYVTGHRTDLPTFARRY